jgi:hypothetical protein
MPTYETETQPKEIPWRLFAIELLVVLLITGAGWLVSVLT